MAYDQAIVMGISAVTFLFAYLGERTEKDYLRVTYFSITFIFMMSLLSVCQKIAHITEGTGTTAELYSMVDAITAGAFWVFLFVILLNMSLWVLNVVMAWYDKKKTPYMELGT